MLELAEKHPLECIKFGKGFALTFDLKRMTTGKCVPRVVWIAGPTGCGKTRFAVEHSLGVPWFTGENLKWFDGYSG